MAEYINRYEALVKLQDKFYCQCTPKVFDEILSIIKKIPAVDVEKVKHGYWKVVSDISDCVDGECSICGYTDVFDESGFYNYCPECGAKMDKKGGANK